MPKKDPAERARAKLELDRFTYQRRDKDHWLNVAAALNFIAVIRGVDRSQARTFLIEACASDSVQSRYVVSLSSQDLGSLSWRAPAWGDLLGDNNAKAYRGIAPATWQRNDGAIDFVTGTYNYDNPDRRYVGEAVIEINAADLAEYLKRPRRGPKPGTVKSLQAEYQALFPTVKDLIDKGKARSANAAALQLAVDGKVPGNGTPENNARGLATAYLKHVRKTL
jgi:hypothetical protein